MDLIFHLSRYIAHYSLINFQVSAECFLQNPSMGRGRYASRRRVVMRRKEFRDAEIQHFDRLFTSICRPRDENVLRFQVAMNEIALMRGVNGGADAAKEVDDAVRRELF